MKKNLLFVLTCIMIVIMSFALLTGCNRSGDDTDTPDTDDTSDTEDTEDADDEDLTDDIANDSGDTDDPDDETVTEATTFDGDLADSGISYSINVDTDVYDTVEEDGGIMVFTSEGEFLDIYFIPGENTAESLAPSFMDSYMDFTDTEFSGVNYVGDTSLYGESIIAHNDEVQFEAWLVDRAGGVLAIVMCYTLENQDEQMARLYEMLDTLEIN